MNNPLVLYVAFLAVCLALLAIGRFRWRNLSLIVALAAFGAQCGVKAQTNAPPATNAVVLPTLTTLGVSTNVASGISSLANSFLDTYPYITNGNALFEAGALKAGSHWGGLLDVQLPVNMNNWQLTYGVAVGYIGGDFVSGSATVSAGTTVNVPGLSQFIGPLYTYASTLAGYDWKKGEVVTGAFAGTRYQYSINSTTSIFAGYGVGTLSDVGGEVQLFTLAFSHKF